MASTINTKIQLRTDLKANWESKNPVLKLGEIAIVCFDNDYKDIKIGNGLSAFNQLSYLYQNAISAESITGKDLHVKSIAQGYNVKATPTSLATGIFSYADGNFDVVHGIEARAKKGDDYAFVFNGKNLPLDGKNFYQSHGEGSFNINPLSGLGGFFIGEANLADILKDYLLSSQISDYWKKCETSSSSELSTEFSKHPLSTDLSLSYDSSSKKISLKAFDGNIGQVDCTDFIKDGMLSTVYLSGNTLVLIFNTDAGKTPISVNLSTFVDDYDAKISALSSAISVIGEDYLDSNDKTQIYNDLLSPDEVMLYKGPGDKDISLSVGTGTQLCVYTATLSDFYLNSETSSAIEISAEFDKKIKIGSYHDKQYDLSSGDLSVVKITETDYFDLIDEEKTDAKVLYVISADQLNAHDQRIIDVAEPVDSLDATNKEYVDTNLQPKVSTSELSIYTVQAASLADANTVNLVVRDAVISAEIPSSSTTILRTWQT